MRQILGGIAFALASVACFAEDYYFSCTGKTGIADGQAVLPLMSKGIASNESKVDGSMHITADRVIIDGIPWGVGTWQICQNDDQTLWFSPSGSKDCVAKDEMNNLGVFNKVTGRLRYHDGDFLAILQCKKTIKLMK